MSEHTDDLKDMVAALEDQFGLPVLFAARRGSEVAAQLGVTLNSVKGQMNIYTLAEYLLPRLPKR